MRFSQFKQYFKEAVQTTISAEHLEGLKDVIARRIKALPDDESTAKALKEIEDMLQHVQHGGRMGSISKEMGEIQDAAVRDAKKVLSRLVLSIMEEVQATPAQRTEFFNLWKSDKLVNVGTLLSFDSVSFSDVFTGYDSNPVVKEFVDEVLNISELGMGRGEFGLNVLSKSISISKAKADNEEDESGAKKGDLQIKLGGKTLQVELKTESGGAARFGDQEVRPAEGYEAAAMALNTFVKKNKMYNQLDRKLSGSGMNLNQAIQFHQIISPADRKKFLGLARECLVKIFGNIKGGRPAQLARLKKNVNDIMTAIELGDNGGAAQAYSQASFNFYMSRKHDDGVLYTNLNNKTFVFYDDAKQLLDQGLRFHASTPYISATKDPVRAVYPQISVQQTTFGGEAAASGIKKLAKGKNPLAKENFRDNLRDWAMQLADRRGVHNTKTIAKIVMETMRLIASGVATDQIIPALEEQFPELKPKLRARTVQPAAQQPQAQQQVQPEVPQHAPEEDEELQRMKANAGLPA